MKIIETLPNGEPASHVNLGQRKAVVVFEAETADALRTTQVGREAIQYAQAGGLVGAAIRDEGFTYAVDEKGNEADPSIPLPATAKFRVNITLGSTI